MPHDQSVVVRPGDEDLALGAACLLISLYRILLHRCVVLRVLEFPRVIVAAGLKDVICRKCHRVDPVRMSLQLVNHVAFGHLPHLDRAVLTSRV